MLVGARYLDISLHLSVYHDGQITTSILTVLHLIVSIIYCSVHYTRARKGQEGVPLMTLFLVIPSFHHPNLSETQLAIFFTDTKAPYSHVLTDRYHANKLPLLSCYQQHSHTTLSRVLSLDTITHSLTLTNHSPTSSQTVSYMV